MSKCSVFITSKSKVRYCTLLRPKYWAEAGELRRSAVEQRRTTSSPRRQVVFIDTSNRGQCKRRTTDALGNVGMREGLLRRVSSAEDGVRTAPAVTGAGRTP